MLLQFDIKPPNPHVSEMQTLGHAFFRVQGMGVATFAAPIAAPIAPALFAIEMVTENAFPIFGFCCRLPNVSVLAA